MTLEELKAEVERATIDTVLLAMTDMQGRLQGKRLTRATSSTRSPSTAPRRCNYLLAVDVEMNTVDGYAMSSWERGYGDFVMQARPRHAARPSRGIDGTALCLADVAWERRHAGRRLAAPGPARASSSASPSAAGRANAGTELEFIVFRDTYEEAWRQRLPRPRRRPTSTTSTTRCSAPRASSRCIRRIRNEMARRRAARRGLQGRVQPRPARDQLPLRRRAARRRRARRSTRTAPRRSPPRRAWRSRSWRSSTSARATRATSTCRCAGERRRAVFADEREAVRPLPRRPCSRTLRELTLFLAPNVNSYKRFAAGSFAPTAVAWGDDNRTCALRVVGHGAGRRVECRVAGRRRQPVPGARALIAAGLHGVDAELELEPPLEGNAYVADRRRSVPATLRDARDAVRRRARRARGVRRGGRRALPQRRARRARRLRRARSPTGSASAASSGL